MSDLIFHDLQHLGISMNKDKYSFYKEHPKSCDPKDFWGQVKRTVNGKSVSQEQIDMIVEASVAGLLLDSDDVLLDICCGNGALTNLLFERCRGGLGVDFSECLISIANQNFAKETTSEYLLEDVVEFCLAPKSVATFTKAMCYGSFSYLEHAQAKEMLKALYDNFPHLKRVFIGNLPDRRLIKLFYGERPVEPELADEPGSAIGIWRTKEQFVEMVGNDRWKVEFSSMAENYYAAHYRYDATLIRI